MRKEEGGSGVVGSTNQREGYVEVEQWLRIRRLFLRLHKSRVKASRADVAASE